MNTSPTLTQLAHRLQAPTSQVEVWVFSWRITSGHQVQNSQHEECIPKHEECGAVLCPAVLCCAALCCAMPGQPLNQLVWAQARIPVGLNAFMTPSLQKLSYVTCLGTPATCPMLQHTQIPYAPVPPFVRLASGQHHSWQRQCCCCAEPPQETPIHLTPKLSSIYAKRHSLDQLCLLCRVAVGVSSQPGFIQSMPKGIIVLCLLCREAAGFSSQPGFLQSMPKGIIVLCLLCREAAGFSSQPGFLQSMPKGIIVLCLLCREAAGVSSQPGSQAV